MADASPTQQIKSDTLAVISAIPLGCIVTGKPRESCEHCFREAYAQRVERVSGTKLAPHVDILR